MIAMPFRRVDKIDGQNSGMRVKKVEGHQGERNNTERIKKVLTV